MEDGERSWLMWVVEVECDKKRKHRTTIQQDKRQAMGWMEWSRKSAAANNRPVTVISDTQHSIVTDEGCVHTVTLRKKGWLL